MAGIINKGLALVSVADVLFSILQLMSIWEKDWL